MSAEEALERVLALHRRVDLVALGKMLPGFPESVQCGECSAHDDETGELFLGFEWMVPWPCPTVRAIQGDDAS